MKWCQLFLFFLLVTAFIPSRNKYLSWDSSLICLYPKLIEVMTWIDWRMQRGMRINWREIDASQAEHAPEETDEAEKVRHKSSLILWPQQDAGSDGWVWKSPEAIFQYPLFTSWPCQYFAENQTTIFRPWWRKQNLLENFPRWACQEPMTLLLLRKHKHELWGTERNFMTQTELDRGEMKIRNHGKDLI